ncbi:hypothetical protein V5799_017637 [Amblyomma americanum]|uniref:C2H2-type domain-containing protein n=1 Tax=Amblyomma americanum TaxID=6943 RepID=A0AAQ4F2P9_AMBAM
MRKQHTNPVTKRIKPGKTSEDDPIRLTARHFIAKVPQTSAQGVRTQRSYGRDLAFLAAWPSSLVVTPVPECATEQRALLPVPPPLMSMTSVTQHGAALPVPFSPAAFHGDVAARGPCALSDNQCDSATSSAVHGRPMDIAVEPSVRPLGGVQDTLTPLSSRAPKPFSCHVCPMSFGFHSQLQVHLRSHTKETPFRCPHCFKGFSQKGNFNRHMRIHM